jgi:membrane-bound hydrogenase subunit beta
VSIEENIKKGLIGRFDFIGENNIKIPRPGRIFLELPPEKFAQIFDYAVRQLKFSHLCTITGFDEKEKLGFMYHLTQGPGPMLNIKISVPKERPVIQSVTPYFSSADGYERELVDLFGAKVEGLAPGNRYPLPDDWPEGQHPMLKDWKQESLKKKG